MTSEEAQALQIAGRYSDVLRGAVREQVAAHTAGRDADELRWSLWAAKACRFLGRATEGIGHAVHAALRARALGRQDLLAEAAYVQALLLKSTRRYDEGLAVLDWAIGQLPPDTPDFARAVFDLDRAELALEAQRPEEARRSLARGAAVVQSLENVRLMAWTLYLRSHFERPDIGGQLLTGAYSIAASMECPELEWHILWRLSECMYKMANCVAEEDCARGALATLHRMAQPLNAEDADAFWREGARAAFLEHMHSRFWPGIEREPSELSGTVGTGDTACDPALMPAFVQESLRVGLPLAG